MRSEWIVPLIFQFAGLLVIVAEVMLPSGGILTIIALGLLGYSIYLVFTGISFDAGVMIVIADLILLPIIAIIGFKMLAKSPLSLQSSLQRSAGVVSYDEKLSELVGKEGVAVTNLRPSGTVKIDNVRVDVVSRGDYIEKGETVRVLKVEGSRVVVGKKTA